MVETVEDTIDRMHERQTALLDSQRGANAAYYNQRHALLTAPPPPPPLDLPVITCDDYCWCCGRRSDG